MTCRTLWFALAAWPLSLFASACGPAGDDAYTLTSGDAAAGTEDDAKRGADGGSGGGGPGDTGSVGGERDGGPADLGRTPSDGGNAEPDAAAGPVPDALLPDGGPCTPIAGPDEPDPEDRDSNCDGVDGDAAQAIFVSPDGDDADPGDRNRPVATLARALTLATDRGATQVLLNGGAYAVPATVNLLEGIGIHGGYDRADAWRRRSDSPSVLRGPTLVFRAEGVSRRTPISRLTAISADAEGPSEASVVLFCNASEGVVAYDGARFEAGRGADGADGLAGTDGPNGNAGSSGGAGSNDDEADPGDGGDGGLNPLCPAANGGPGGDGGRSSGFRGADGGPGAGGAAGGAGGSTNSCGGSSGADGSAGGGPPPISGDGTAGLPAGRFAVDPVLGLIYEAADGAPGVDGVAGRGGGGGGGSSGETGFACVDGAGNGGGGGGAGGCGGLGGGGGGGGGASVAIVAFGAPPGLDGVTLVTAGGGNGGAGAPGGQGGLGGPGGRGADSWSGEIGSAGDGGPGGPGGQGGTGAAGGGGPSVGVWSDAAEPAPRDTAIMLGPPGRGGAGPIPGPPGLSTEVYRP